MEKIKRALWFTAGILFLGLAYLGTIVPGLPWSTPALLATWCFSKSSKRFHDYMINHRLFGSVIRDWGEGRVFPKYAKLAMFLSMDGSLIIMWFTTHNVRAVIAMAIFFALILIWASRYPGSRAEADRRRAAGEKLGWFK
jgi:uncharacterized protein